MANNGTKIYISSGADKGVRIKEDIKTVLGQTGVNSTDLGTLCKSNKVNPWAKYKPIRNSSKGITSSSVWSTAAQAVMYGFRTTNNTSAYNTLSFGWNSLPPSWEQFYRDNGAPRGVATYDEPYRQLDFADLAVNTNGYDHSAMPPLKITLPANIQQGGSTIEVWKDSNSFSAWNSSTCISFNDIFPATETNYNLAVLFLKEVKQAGTDQYVLEGHGNMLVMPYTPADLGTSSACTIAFKGLSTAQGIDIPMFSDTSTYDHKAVDRDHIRVVVGLVAGQAPTAPLNYKIMYIGSTSDSTWPTFNGDLHSLEMRYERLQANPVSYADLVYYVPNSIFGTEPQYDTAATLSATITPVTTQSGDVATYKIENINVQYTNRSDRWGTLTSAQCKIYITISGQAWYLSAGLNGSDPEPADTSTPFAGDTVLILNSDSQNSVYTTAAMNSSDTLPHTAAALVTNGSGGNFHEIKRPYIHFLGGVNPTITISGYLFAGGEVVAPADENKISMTSATINLTL